MGQEFLNWIVVESSYFGTVVDTLLLNVLTVGVIFSDNFELFLLDDCDGREDSVEEKGIPLCSAKEISEPAPLYCCRGFSNSNKLAAISGMERSRESLL